MPDLQSEPQTSAPSAGLDSNSSSKAQDQGTDALAHLAKMSGTGSAFGQAEYVAINPAAIGTLLLGFIGALSLLLPLFLFIPAVAIVCGAIAIRQIRNSNGTQTGIGFAAGGIALSVLLGGTVLIHQAVDWARARAASKECAVVIESFGQGIRNQNYDGVYDGLFTESFREKVERKTFTNVLRDLQNNKTIGGVEYTRWNGESMVFEPIEDSDAKMAYTMILLKFVNISDSAREQIVLTNKEGDWKLDSIPRMFPEKSAKKSADSQ